MKKRFIYGFAAFAMAFSLVACGGESEENTEEGTENTETTEEVVAVENTIDAEASTINWWAMDGEEKGHTGTIAIKEGTYTVEGDKVTAAAMSVDMGSMTSDSEKLTGHLQTADFFDIENYGSTTFTFNKHEDGVVYGTLSVVGMEMAVEAPVTVSEGAVAVSDFSVDMVQLPFFQTERAEKPEAEWHNTNIWFNANIVAK
ncbi:YceI family protein [Paracrocinitomix mangrovi]|uniref:YceI family protein n=1 Tax=Paracrocinitomix mangrovi TaxID=2862509 RepID=UPI001C8DADD1|nr:YceI family protein [Paracrocinitomix mangrovi]UKN00907.1 YceI family protein [Paracrocinitomix mangrovi]